MKSLTLTLVLLAGLPTAQTVADPQDPIANPAIDTFGNIYTTFSGSRGQKVPVAVYRIDLNFNMKPFINEMMNGLRKGRSNGVRLFALLFFALWLQGKSKA